MLYSRKGSVAPACSRYGRNHQDKCRDGQTYFIKCGQEGQFFKECPKNMQGKSIDRGTTLLYDVYSHQENEDSPDVAIGMIKVFDFTIYSMI